MTDRDDDARPAPAASPPPAESPPAAASPPPDESPPAAEGPAPVEERRLHPMTLVQRFLLSLPALFFLLLPVLRNPGADTWISLLIAGAYAVLALPLIVLQYLRFRYTITPREIVIRSGVLNRQHRNIPIERVQNVEIEQQLLPRLFGMAKVKIETAGSTTTEGVLEYVALDEARHVRETIRGLQRRTGPAATPPPGDDAAADAADGGATAEAAPDYEARLPLGRVLLSGAFRFSLLYIAVIFSGLQYLEPDPEAMIDWITRGRLEPLVAYAETSPWLTGLLALVTAALLSWLTGIAVNLNKYYGFRLRLADGKLHKKHGLLTLTERTLPLGRLQALLLRTNPLMRRFGWYALEVQTMGFDVQQRGHQTALPFARMDEVMDLAPRLYPVARPDGFARVSRLTIRRAFVRYSVLLALAAGGAGYFWTPALWALLAWPLLFGLAVLRWRHHGWALHGDVLYVRRGVFRHYVWMIPLEKFQVFYATASLFQRRLGLKSVLVDTAGAAAIASPEIADLPAADADALLETLTRRFQAQMDAARATVDDPAWVDGGAHPVDGIDGNAPPPDA